MITSCFHILRAAFYIVDHFVFLRCLRNGVGIKAIAPQLDLTNGTFAVGVENNNSFLAVEFLKGPFVVLFFSGRAFRATVSPRIIMGMTLCPPFVYFACYSSSLYPIKVIKYWMTLFFPQLFKLSNWSC